MGFIVGINLDVCGSAACLAGRAAIQAGEDGIDCEDSEIMNVAGSYLGLDEYQALALFHSTAVGDPRMHGGIYATIPFEDLTPAVGARVLREVVAVTEQGSEVSERGIVLAWAESTSLLPLPDTPEEASS